MPTSRASSTARLDGAPTAATTGTPAIAAFCTSSKLARPLRKSTRVAERQRARASSAAPTSLSTALCRPDVLPHRVERPSASNSAAAWRPPVASKTACAARARLGHALDDVAARAEPEAGRARRSCARGPRRWTPCRTPRSSSSRRSSAPSRARSTRASGASSTRTTFPAASHAATSSRRRRCPRCTGSPPPAPRRAPAYAS